MNISANSSRSLCVTRPDGSTRHARPSTLIAGTPYCLTVDGQTLQDQTVTIRDRDTLKQERVAIAELDAVIRARLRS